MDRVAALFRGCFSLLIPVWVKSGSGFCERPRLVEFEKKSIMKENVKVRGFETICENSEKEQRENKSRKKSVIHKNNGLFWWGRTDSNHRSETQQIYSLSPLATRELPQI